MVEVNRFDVFLTRLDPTTGSEQQKTRPCVVVSPDSMNHQLNTVIVVPLTSKTRNFPYRVACTFKHHKSDAMCEQIRTVDTRRFVKRLGKLDSRTGEKISDILVEMFA